MKSHLFLAIATGLASIVAAKTVSTTITTCNCTTSSATATPLYGNTTSLETLISTTSITHTVSEVFTPQTEVTLYTNATSTSCNSASTVYETTTPISTLVVTVTPSSSVSQPHFATVTPPYTAGNTSRPCASSGMPAGPSGWPNPSWSPSSSKIPLGTATSSVVSRTSMLYTPTHTVWDGSGRSFAPPRLFALVAQVFSLVAATRGQIVNFEDSLNSEFYPEPQEAHVSSGIGASTELSPLPAFTSSSSDVASSTSIETATSGISGVVSFPPLASSSFWNSSSIETTVTKTLESVSSSHAVPSSSSSEVDVTVTIYTSNCSSTTVAPETASTVTSNSISVVFANSTLTQFSTITPAMTPSTAAPTTANFTTPNHSSSSSTSSTMSMQWNGDAAALEVLPGWLIGLGMFMMF